MQINVAQLLKEPVGAERIYTIDQLTGENKADHVEGEVTLTRTNTGILVTGDLSAEINGVCSRCLGPARNRVKYKIEDEYFPVFDVNSGTHVRVEPDLFTIGQNHILDLDEAIRQYTITAVPTRLLCKPDCQGFGANYTQNAGPAKVTQGTQQFDHRWDKLIEAKEKESKTQNDATS